MGSQRCVAVLTSHLVLGVLCLVVGFLCPFHFGWYDSCDLIEPERTFDGWSIYRDMSDFYILLIFIGFILLGVAFGIIGSVQKSEKLAFFRVIQWYFIWTIKRYQKFGGIWTASNQTGLYLWCISCLHATKDFNSCWISRNVLFTVWFLIHTIHSNSRYLIKTSVKILPGNHLANQLESNFGWYLGQCCHHYCLQWSFHFWKNLKSANKIWIEIRMRLGKNLKDF